MRLVGSHAFAEQSHSVNNGMINWFDVCLPRLYMYCIIRYDLGNVECFTVGAYQYTAVLVNCWFDTSLLPFSDLIYHHV